MLSSGVSSSLTALEVGLWAVNLASMCCHGLAEVSCRHVETQGLRLFSTVHCMVHEAQVVDDCLSLTLLAIQAQPIEWDAFCHN